MMFFFFFCRRHYNVRFDLPSGHPYSVFLLGDSAFKYTPSYDEVKNKFTLTFKKPQSKHKTSKKNYDNLFEYDSNVLPYSQNFRFASYRINLHMFLFKENGKITHICKFCGLYMLPYT